MDWALVNISHYINKEINVTENEWVKEFPGKIEVCDKDGILLKKPPGLQHRKTTRT